MITPGTPWDHSLFHSELAGQYGLLLTLWHIMEASSSLQGSIVVTCNGHLVLDCLWLSKAMDPFAAYFNLFQAYQYLLACIPCKIIFMHVKGH